MRWRDSFILDFVKAVLEATIVLLISSISLIVLSLNYGLETTGISLYDAAFTTFSSSLQPTEVIIYITGILSSTTAYYLVRIASVRRYYLRVIVIVCTPFILFFFATPLFLSGLDGGPANQQLAIGLASTLGVSAAFLWLIALFNQRRIFERHVSIAGDQRGYQIAKSIEKSQ